MSSGGGGRNKIFRHNTLRSPPAPSRRQPRHSSIDHHAPPSSHPVKRHAPIEAAGVRGMGTTELLPPLGSHLMRDPRHLGEGYCIIPPPDVHALTMLASAGTILGMSVYAVDGGSTKRGPITFPPSPPPGPRCQLRAHKEVRRRRRARRNGVTEGEGWRQKRTMLWGDVF